MKDYQAEFEKFQIPKVEYPDYTNAEEFANKFKRCTVYEYGTITYSGNSKEGLKYKDYKNA